MPVRELIDLTWPEARALAEAGAVAVLPVGALEAHGPHLPIGTDVVIAEAMAREGARRISAHDRAAVLLPPLAFTPAPFAAAFAGTVSVSPDSVVRTIVDIADALTRQGFAALALANAHFDPAHVEALRAAVTAARDRDLLTVVFPDLTRRPLAARLTEEFRSGACHAGRYEGSIVLAERPELVRDGIRRALAPNPVSLSDAIREGRRTFREAGGPDAYFGAPAEASVEEGRASVDTLGAILAEAVGAVLTDVEE